MCKIDFSHGWGSASCLLRSICCTKSSAEMGIRMKKVLIIATLGLRYEGITSVILNYVKHIDCTGMDLHFVSTCTVENRRKKEFEMFGQVHEVPNRKKELIAYLKQIVIILKTGFDVIHVHGNSGTMAIEMFIAKLYSIPVRIVHGHSSSCSHPFLNHGLRIMMRRWSTIQIACSAAAGEFLCGGNPYILLNNAIDIEQFRYDGEVRKLVRAEYYLNDTFVLGHIGSFEIWKNHYFLVDLIRHLRSKGENVKLFLVGDGSLRQKLEQEVKNANLEESVVFCGRKSDTWRYYSAMDMFVMPSKWEGMPMVLLEAQASGLPALVSDRVTSDSKILDSTEYLDLDLGAGYWADYIIRNFIENNNSCKRLEAGGKMKGSRFDIETEANRLREIYLRD